VLIDAFTIGAQIVNFLILLFLLRRFLYRPIVQAMQARQERIAAEQREAAAARQEAERLAEDYRERKERFERERERLMHEARQEAEALRREKMQAARQEVEQASARWNRSLRQEQETFLRDLREQGAQALWEACARALGDLADASLEAQVLKAFLTRLEALPDEELQALRARAGEASGEVAVASRFPIPGPARERLAQTLRERLGAPVDLRFEEDASVLAGVELRAEGHTLAWSMAGYLEAVQGRLGEALTDFTGGQES
jgi:F-type H+-transporting ATPase subunit b